MDPRPSTDTSEPAAHAPRAARTAATTPCPVLHTTCVAPRTRARRARSSLAPFSPRRGWRHRRPAPTARRPAPPPASTQGVPAYWTVASDGGVFAFGGLALLRVHGRDHARPRPWSASPPRRARPAPTARATGPWPPTAGSSPSATPPFHGSMGAVKLNKPMVGMAADPATGGYWTVASDGGVFAFDAPFFGSMGGGQAQPSPWSPWRPPPTAAATGSFASDGGVFAFGDAGFYGSLGKLTLQRAHRGRRPPPTAAATGWSPPTAGSSPSATPASSDRSAATPWRAPWWAMAAADPGRVLADRLQRRGHRLRRRRLLRLRPPAHHEPGGGHRRRPRDRGGRQRRLPVGELRLRHLEVPGQPARVHQHRCPSGHTVGIVAGHRASPTGPPTRAWPTRRQWAGGGLNLYIFMTYGTDTTNQPGCNGDAGVQLGVRGRASTPTSTRRPRG